jgi:hypothetical protein
VTADARDTAPRSRDAAAPAGRDARDGRVFDGLRDAA